MHRCHICALTEILSPLPHNIKASYNRPQAHFRYQQPTAANEAATFPQNQQPRKPTNQSETSSHQDVEDAMQRRKQERMTSGTKMALWG